MFCPGEKDFVFYCSAQHRFVLSALFHLVSSGFRCRGARKGGQGGCGRGAHGGALPGHHEGRRPAGPAQNKTTDGMRRRRWEDLKDLEDLGSWSSFLQRFLDHFRQLSKVSNMLTCSNSFWITCDISQFHMCNYSFVSIFVWGESRTGAGTCSYGPGHTSSSQQVPQSSWFCDILKHGVIENCIL